jgi:hypothetical protein
VNSGEVGTGEHRIADRRPAAVDEVDDAVRQPCLLEEAHRVGGGERGRRCRLPDDRVPHQRGRAGQVPTDRREVERAHGEDEALERPVLHAVPDAGGGAGLLGIDPGDVVDVEAEEIDQLAAASISAWCAVFDWLSIVAATIVAPGRRAAPLRGGRLRLAPPRTSGPVVPRVGGRLIAPRPRRAGLVHVCEGVLLACGITASTVSPVRTSSPPITQGRRVALVPFRRAFLQLGALGRAGRIVLDRLVRRRRRPEDAVRPSRLYGGGRAVVATPPATGAWGAVARRGRAPVWHELPTRTLELTRAGPHGARPPTITLAVPVHAFATEPCRVARRIAAYFEGERLPSTTSRSTWVVHASAAGDRRRAARSAVRRDGHLRRASPRSPAGRGRPGRRRVLRPEPAAADLPVPPRVAAGGSGATGRSGSVQAPPSGARGASL